jgi:hypothetical protein
VSQETSNNKGIEREKLPLRKRWLLEETKNNNFAPLSLGSKALLSFCSLCLRLKSRVDANKAKQSRPSREGGEAEKLRTENKEGEAARVFTAR